MTNHFSFWYFCMFNRYDLVHLPGKRDRKVPLILAPEWIEAMESLVKFRTTCHISSQYFFGKSHSSAYIQPWQVLFDFCHVLVPSFLSNV